MECRVKWQEVQRTHYNDVGGNDGDGYGDDNEGSDGSHDDNSGNANDDHANNNIIYENNNHHGKYDKDRKEENSFMVCGAIPFA